MITFSNACNIIKKTVIESKDFELVDTEQCIKRILSKTYSSKLDLPRENLSSMDGAVIFKNEMKKKLKITGESKAGDIKGEKFKPGQCHLIYTGAPIYGENKKVIPKENFIKKNGYIYISSFPKQSFIRKKSSDLKKNKIYLKKKEVISLRSLALAKSMKINTLSVKKKPRVFIICTGDEIICNNKEDSLVTPTNHIFIQNLVKTLGGEVIKILFSSDEESDFIDKFNSEKNFDLLITSGGISRGKYDIVKNTLKKNGLSINFDRVAIKPGKPTTFGVFHKKKYFLGLPGNPISCFMSMINFFPIFVNSFYGLKFSEFLFRELKSKRSIDKNDNLTRFERVYIKGNFFKVFSNQDSSMLHLLNEANGILVRKPHGNKINRDQKEMIMLLNNLNTYEI